MKIAVVGMGVAGSYIINKLSDEHDVIGYEKQSKDQFDAICAWGTTKCMLTEFMKECGLNFDDYVYLDGKEMEVDMGEERFWINLKGLCTYDKAKLEEDLIEGRNVMFGKFMRRESLGEDYDLIVDSTALRAILPIDKKRMMIPCIEYKIKYKEQPFDDFYIRPSPSLAGYFWYFPLGDGCAHVGAGDFYGNHNKIVNDFMKKYPGEILKKLGRPIGVSPPSKCEPFYQDNIVGVGESIGTVFPLLGEGIIPSLQCSNILLENLEDMESYRREVLENFGAYDAVYDIVKAKIENRYSIKSNFLDLLRTYFYMKKRENRFGLKVSMFDMLKLMNKV
tara:strand:+ start:70 stop:1074 length:1005 start_codon:yes stop_codon:yes gene_type:complete